MKCRLKKFTYCCSILFFFGKKNIFYSENILHIIANGNGLYVNIFDGVFKTKKNMGVGGGGGGAWASLWKSQRNLYCWCSAWFEIRSGICLTLEKVDRIWIFV